MGYGDVSISTPEARLFAFFHILLSVSWLGASISQFGELKTVRQAQLTEFEMLQKQLDEKLIQSLDKDGQGVERVEFVVGMLSNLGATYAGAPRILGARMLANDLATFQFGNVHWVGGCGRFEHNPENVRPKTHSAKMNRTSRFWFVAH